jgi:hypothetical protein
MERLGFLLVDRLIARPPAPLGIGLEPRAAYRAGFLFVALHSRVMIRESECTRATGSPVMADISAQSAKIASRARRVLEANPSTDDFSFDIWRQIFRTIARNEKKAMDNCETVHFEIEVSEREVHLPDKISILKMQLVCEPGKQVRLA